VARGGASSGNSSPVTTSLARSANCVVPTSKLVVVARHGGPDADLSALLVTNLGKVRSDADFVFYGQPRSAEGAVAYGAKRTEGGGFVQEIVIDLCALPAGIERVKLTLTIDPAARATFAQVRPCEITLFDEGSGSRVEVARICPEGSSENAFIVAELYRHQGSWKVRHVAQGFENGLAGIATAFGVSVDDDGSSRQQAPAPARGPSPAPVAPSVSLSKVDRVTEALASSGSRLVSLQKAASVSLKKHRLDGVVARVILVLDASGSTLRMWPKTIQAVVDRLATLALNLDDDGALELWGYASSPKKYLNVTQQNLDGYVERIQKEGKSWLSLLSGPLPGLGVDNREPLVLRAILHELPPGPGAPSLCIFVTDGGIFDNDTIASILVEAATRPVFWQFVGLGGSGYGILERFDSLPGRPVDNTGFFAIDDYNAVSDEELYDRLLKEFPSWLAEARRTGNVRA
jgi:stress response protein SCP2